MEDGWRWMDMETDCLISILRRLSFEDLTLGIPFVCKSWYSSSRDPSCWQHLDFRELDFRSWSRFTKRVRTQYPLSRLSFSAFMKFAVGRSRGSVVELRFPPFFHVSIDDLVYVSNECPRLKILVLSCLKMEEEMHIPKLVARWKELEWLEVEANPSSFPDLAAEISLNCKKFRGLKMAGVRKQDALAIVNHLPKLKCLDLSMSYLSKETLLMIMDGCQEIESLSVNHCIGFEADEEVLAKASRIKSFEHRGSKLRLDANSDYVDSHDLQHYVQ